MKCLMMVLLVRSELTSLNCIIDLLHSTRRSWSYASIEVYFQDIAVREIQNCWRYCLVELAAL